MPTNICECEPIFGMAMGDIANLHFNNHTTIQHNLLFYGKWKSTIKINKHTTEEKKCTKRFHFWFWLNVVVILAKSKEMKLHYLNVCQFYAQYGRFQNVFHTNQAIVLTRLLQRMWNEIEKRKHLVRTAFNAAFGVQSVSIT